MAEPRFQAVVLDLFGTLVEWDPHRLPRLQIGERSVPSTIPLLVPVLEAALGPRFVLDAWIDAYFGVMHEIERERMGGAVEVTCLERFRRVLTRLGEPDDGRAAELAEALRLRHMTAVRSVTTAPAERAEVVRRLARRHRVALLSNFDDAETGRTIVRDTGVGDLFEVVIVSAEECVRKPDPRIFQRMLGRLGVSPGEALFVGDTFLEDVVGAQGVGMPVVWLSQDKGPMPPGHEPPDFEIPALTALPALLEVE